jgi:hypothetical protein
MDGSTRTESGSPGKRRTAARINAISCDWSASMPTLSQPRNPFRAAGSAR